MHLNQVEICKTELSNFFWCLRQQIWSRFDEIIYQLFLYFSKILLICSICSHLSNFVDLTNDGTLIPVLIIISTHIWNGWLCWILNLMKYWKESNVEFNFNKITKFLHPFFCIGFKIRRNEVQKLDSIYLVSKISFELT